MQLLTVREAAAALSVSKRWFQYWLAAHPVDAAGNPFYIPFGSRKKFEQQDLVRIKAHMRELERARLGPMAAASARQAELMSTLGNYDHLVAVRDGAKRREEAAKKPLRRARLPKA